MIYRPIIACDVFEALDQGVPTMYTDGFNKYSEHKVYSVLGQYIYAICTEVTVQVWRYEITKAHYEHPGDHPIGYWVQDSQGRSYTYYKDLKIVNEGSTTGEMYEDLSTRGYPDDIEDWDEYFEGDAFDPFYGEDPATISQDERYRLSKRADNDRANPDNYRAFSDIWEGLIDEKVVVPNTITTIANSCFYRLLNGFDPYQDYNAGATSLQLPGYYTPTSQQSESAYRKILAPERNEITVHVYRYNKYGEHVDIYKGIPADLLEHKQSMLEPIHKLQIHGVKEIRVCGSLTRIGDRAFMNDSQSTGVDLPQSRVTEADLNVILTRYQQDILCPVPKESWDAQTSTEDTKLYRMYSKLENIVFYGVDRLQYVGEEAFSTLWRIRSIYLGDRYKRYGKGVFENCTNLKSAILEQDLVVQPHMFNNCLSLQSFNHWNNIHGLGGGENGGDGYHFHNCPTLRMLCFRNTIILPANNYALFKKIFTVDTVVINCEALDIPSSDIDPTTGGLHTQIYSKCKATDAFVHQWQYDNRYCTWQGGTPGGALPQPPTIKIKYLNKSTNVLRMLLFKTVHRGYEYGPAMGRRYCVKDKYGVVWYLPAVSGTQTPLKVQDIPGGGLYPQTPLGVVPSST